MRLAITLDQQPVNPLLLPTITVLTALRNAIDTNSNMLENPAIVEGNHIYIDMYWENEVTPEEETNFKERTIRALQYILSEAGIEYTIEWK